MLDRHLRHKIQFNSQLDTVRLSCLEHFFSSLRTRRANTTSVSVVRAGFSLSFFALCALVCRAKTFFFPTNSTKGKNGPSVIPIIPSFCAFSFFLRGESEVFVRFFKKKVDHNADRFRRVVLFFVVRWKREELN